MFLDSSLPSSIWHYNHIKNLHSQKKTHASRPLQFWLCVTPLRHVNPANPWRLSTHMKPFEILLWVLPPLFLLSLYFVYFLGTILTELMDVSLLPTFKCELRHNHLILVFLATCRVFNSWYVLGIGWIVSPRKYINMLKSWLPVPHNMILCGGRVFVCVVKLRWGH